jgi:hypothetical protein
MYCSSCGAEVLGEMSYCNRCGASLKQGSTQVEAAPARSVGAAWAISAAVAFITLGGFALIFSVIMALVSRGVDLKEGGGFLIFATLLVILAIDWLLIRQLPRLMGSSSKSQTPDDAAAKTEKRKPLEKPVAQLAASREPVSSVTDHTTRTFEPIYRERETKP